VTEMELPDDQSFDLMAASLRADTADLPAFLEVLAAKLVDALPGMVTVKRSGGMFARTKPVSQIDVSLDDRRYSLAATGSRLNASVAHEVRGVRLSGDDVPLDTWLSELSKGLNAYAAQHASGAAALRRLLS
jgi:hypothetical protein